MTQPRQVVYVAPQAYSAGACNIGPAEIAGRRMSGHLGLASAVGLSVILVAAGAPHLLRLILFVPAAGSAAGYLQAWFHFCAGFGTKGVYNFGPRGSVIQVVDPADRRRDLIQSLRIGIASFAIGAAVAIVAVLLPF
jgi:hypothetical protein